VTREVACAGCCGRKCPPSDGHAVGWRPICEACRAEGRTWWFDSYAPSFTGCGAVKGPRADTFGKDPNSKGFLLPQSLIRKKAG
jgi:hypothetical protein